jgi:uncharacterized protein YerC
MSQISRNKLDVQVYEKIFSLFPRLLYKMTSKGRQLELIDSFFTRTEKVIFAKRIAIAFMLTKGYSYRAIAHKIKVSTGTILKIAESLRLNNQSTRKELESMATEDAFTDFLSAIGYSLAVALPPKSGNWSTWRGRIEKEKKAAKNPF